MRSPILCGNTLVGSLAGRGRPRCSVEVSGGVVRLRIDDADESERWLDVELSLNVLVQLDAAGPDVEVADDLAATGDEGDWP